jgi:hypothetical protein
MMIIEPILIEDLIEINKEMKTEIEIDGNWYIAKGIILNDIMSILERIYHAWLVLIGKAQAFQYMEDIWIKKI